MSNHNLPMVTFQLMRRPLGMHWTDDILAGELFRHKSTIKIFTIITTCRANPESALKFRLTLNLFWGQQWIVDSCDWKVNFFTYGNEETAFAVIITVLYKLLCIEKSISQIQLWVSYNQKNLVS